MSLFHFTSSHNKVNHNAYMFSWDGLSQEDALLISFNYLTGMIYYILVTQTSISREQQFYTLEHTFTHRLLASNPYFKYHSHNSLYNHHENNITFCAVLPMQ